MQWLQTEDDLDMSRWIIFITAYSKLIFAFYNWRVGSELELEGQNLLLCYSGGNGNVVKFSLNFKSLISKQTDFVFGNPKTLAVYVYGSVGMVSIYLCIQTPSYSQGLSLSRLQSLACTFFVLERSNLSG